MRNKSASFHRSFPALMVAAATSAPAIAQDPISAIDWLNSGRGFDGQFDSQPAAIQPSTPDSEPAVATSVAVPEVTTRPLDAPRAGAAGLLPGSVTGLPPTLWQNSQAGRLSRLLSRLDATGNPAMQSLLYTLLLAEAEPPRDDGSGLGFLLARIDALTDLGAVEPALALAERADPTADKDLFQRWFDLALLSGEENRACKAMVAQPTFAPTQTALAYCRARLGDWDTAALTFGSAAALGVLPRSELQLMRLFLDPDLAENTPPLPPATRITPLAFRLNEAIGHPLPTTNLPRAYAMSDLRGLSGWKAEIEAAERLARSGALSENRLLGIYTDRAPAASGGLWDRVALVGQLDAAITARDAAAISEVLPVAWAAISAARLELPFARLWGATLAEIPLTGSATHSAFDMALLAPAYETLARDLTVTSPRDAFLLDLAAGDPQPDDLNDPRAAAIAKGFAPETEVPPTLRLNLGQDQLGEAILSAMILFLSGAAGETKDIAPALATFRAVGLEDVARRAALQLMILDRHG